MVSTVRKVGKAAVKLWPSGKPRVSWCVCVCNPWNHRDPFGTVFASQLFSLCSRGVWHSRPTTRNEAVGESGKGNLASFLYLL